MTLTEQISLVSFAFSNVSTRRFYITYMAYIYFYWMLTS